AMASMPSNTMLPESGSCKVAMVRINDDLPARLGPSSPNMPAGICKETLRRAATLPYDFDRLRIVSTRLLLDAGIAPGAHLRTWGELGDELTRSDAARAYRVAGPCEY